MLSFRNQYFFTKPVYGTKGDMEFELFDMNGKNLGTNFFPNIDQLQYSEVEKEMFLDMIEEQTSIMAVMVKFADEFNLSLDNWKETDLKSDELAEIMESNYGFSSDEVKKLLV